MLLLERAEAYALKGDLQSAIADVNTELSVYHKASPQVTVEGVTEYYNSIEYYRPQDTSDDRIYYTPKKHLHRFKKLQSSNPMWKIQLRIKMPTNDGLKP